MVTIHATFAAGNQSLADFMRRVNVRARRHANQDSFVPAQPARHLISVLGFQPQIAVGSAGS